MDNKPYSDGEQEQEPLRDVNSMARLRIQDEDIEGMWHFNIGHCLGLH